MILKGIKGLSNLYPSTYSSAHTIHFEYNAVVIGKHITTLKFNPDSSSLSPNCEFQGAHDLECIFQD